MATINWIEVKRPGRAPGVGKPLDYSFRISSHSSGRKEDESKQGCIGVTEVTMKALRWQIGDRVLIGMSTDKCDIFLKRVPTGGLALSVAGSHKTKDCVGKSLNASVKSSSLVFNLAETVYIGTNDYIVIDDGVVMFSIPKPATLRGAA